MSLVETEWLNKNINNLKIIDCSWHMPQTNRDGLKEYKNTSMEDLGIKIDQSDFDEHFGKIFLEKLKNI